MAKAQFPHDKELRRLKKRRRFLKRSIRKAKRRLAIAKLQRRPKRRIGKVREFITKRRKQLAEVQHDIDARRKTLRYRLRMRPKKGLGWYDGKQVANWIIPFLQYGRAHGWNGGVTSGYRSYARQWNIYYVQRIRPAARPGTSNHEGRDWPRGAVDVSDPWTLARIVRGKVINGKRLVHYGPGDIWHHSATGR